tara:strand:+ start:401 stop:502 length:102 start_codon:yes stop_codon:yes gene_type:complete
MIALRVTALALKEKIDIKKTNNNDLKNLIIPPI